MYANQNAQYHHVKRNIEALLCEGAFMNGGRDEQVLNQSFICIL